MEDIRNALKARSTELNYSGIMIRLADSYQVDFTQLSELLPRYQCEHIFLVQDPTDYRFLSKESPFYRAYFDNYVNLKKDTSEFYLIVKILEAERLLINPDIQLPVYSKKPPAGHKADQGNPVQHQITEKAKAKAIRIIFFIDLLNQFSAYKRFDFRKAFSRFINNNDNRFLKNDLLTFFPFVTELWKLRESGTKNLANDFITKMINSLPSDSESEIKKSVYRYLSKTMFSKESNKSTKYKYPLFDLDKHWPRLKTEFPNVWATQPQTDLINPDPQNLKLSLITDTEIPLMTTSPELLTLLETSKKQLSFPKESKDPLAFNFTELVQAFSEVRRSVPLVTDPMDNYMRKLPQQWQSLKLSYFSQRYFHEMDRQAVFLLARLSEAESKVTGISPNPPDYEEALNSASDHDDAFPTASESARNLTIKSWQITKEFVQSLHHYLESCQRRDFKTRLNSYCQENGFAALLPGLIKDSAKPVNQMPIPVKTSVNSGAPVHRQTTITTESRVPNQAASPKNNARSPGTTDHRTAAMTRYYQVPTPRRPAAPAPPDQRQQRARAKQKTDSRCIIA